MENLYPVYLNLENQVCLVAGGGKVAERKIRSLLECGAKVRLVSPEVTDRIKQWVQQGTLEWLEREYRFQDLAGVFLVFAATDNSKVNQTIARHCFDRGLAVNLVTDPTKGNFHVPAVVRRGKLTLAVSTGGASPLMAARIRRQLETQFGPEYGELLELLADLRCRALDEVEDINRRKAIFTELVESDILELLKAKKYDQAKERVERAYRSHRS